MMVSSHFTIPNMYQMLVATLPNTYGVCRNKAIVLMPALGVIVMFQCGPTAPHSRHTQRWLAGWLRHISVDKLSRLVADVSLA